MDDCAANEALRAGDHVALLEDDWTMVGLDLVLVDVEPVVGSSQCVISTGSDRITVNRRDLRRA